MLFGVGRARRGARQRQHQHQEREQWLRQKQLQRQRKQRLQQQPRQQRRQWLGCFSEWGALARPRTFRATGVETRQITDAGVKEAARGKGMRTMRTPLRKEILDHVFHVIELVRPIVEGIGRRDRDLASQVRRAMSSVGLNLAEAFGTASGNARLRFETARGSLYEVQAGIGIAIAWGFVSQADAAGALQAIDGLGARVFGLSRR